MEGVRVYMLRCSLRKPAIDNGWVDSGTKVVFWDEQRYDLRQYAEEGSRRKKASTENIYIYKVMG